MLDLVQTHLRSPRCRPCVRARRADARAPQIAWDDLMESLTGGPTPLLPLFQPSQSTATTRVRCRSVLQRVLQDCPPPPLLLPLPLALL